MASFQVISLEFLLWSQWLLLWSIALYGAMPDPLKTERAHIQWRGWIVLLLFRAILAATLAYALSRSIVLSSWLLLIVLFQPVLRSLLSMRFLPEYESFCTTASLACSLAVIRHLHLSTRWLPTFVSGAHLAALCILASTLSVVVRGGTYMVRGILTKSGTLPSDAQVSTRHGQSPTSIAASVESSIQTVDAEEYNRGRLIGNLERIVLTIVVAAGSYAALAFLVAAKGIVRSDEFDKNRDFAEYFLIGSLSSVLVALCAGIALRFAMVRLWPDLLSLQIQ